MDHDNILHKLLIFLLLILIFKLKGGFRQFLRVMEIRLDERMCQITLSNDKKKDATKGTI